MNRNVGVSFGLSVLTVVFFAVVLYQPDHHPALPTAARNPAVEVVEALPPPEPPEPVAASARHVPPPPAPAPVVAARRPVVAREPAAAGRTVAQEERAPSAAVARPVSRRVSRAAEARGAFTQARPGETLADVATRVYGSADAAKSLWHSNRDLLDRADGPLAPGALLRTP